MTPSLTIRATAGLLALSGMLLTLTGCGGTQPPGKTDPNDKKDEKSPGLSIPNPKGDPKGDPKLGPALPPRKVDLDSGAGKEAVAFLKSLGEGAAKAEQLSAGFVKQVGLPVELPADKSRGFSTDAAASWLKRVGEHRTYGLPTGFAGAEAAVVWGAASTATRTDYYSLRMVNEAGAWKVDFLSISSVANTSEATAAAGPEAEYQKFAAAAAIGALCDGAGMPKDDRAMVLAAAFVPALRTAWAEPFGSDREQGFDYNRGKLLLKAGEIGGATESYSVSQQGSAPEFTATIAKSGGAKSTWLVKLTRGPTPGQWLVESITAK